MEIALVRAAADARELAERTGTKLLIRERPKSAGDVAGAKKFTREELLTGVPRTTCTAKLTRVKREARKYGNSRIPALGDMVTLALRGRRRFTFSPPAPLQNELALTSIIEKKIHIIFSGPDVEVALGLVSKVAMFSIVLLSPI